MLDCVVIGGGPAGLTAAIYLGRFRRQVLVIDAGQSHTSWIPLSRNLPGFPDGVQGEMLLDQMRDQARKYGATLLQGEAHGLSRAADGVFRVKLDDGELRAQTTLLATGVVEVEPRLPHIVDAVKRGVIRICPICDGYETIGKRVAVLGAGEHGAAEALFLRTYASDMTLLLTEDAPLSQPMLDKLTGAGVRISHVPIETVQIEAGDVTALTLEDGAVHRFDTVYSAYGVKPRSAFAEALGAPLDPAGRLYVDAHQQTCIDGLYAAGDLVRGLNQISVANGEAAIAATAIHNRLPKVLA